MKVVADSHIGLCRKLNEDRMFYKLEKIGAFDNLFILCDGMGGENAGDYASLKAVEYLLDYLKNAFLGEVFSIFREAINYANDKLFKEASEDINKRGMGTTLVLATIKENTLYVANIGDSRLYLLKDERLIQITKDHNLSAELLALNKLDKDSIEYRINKNSLTRALGVTKDVKADFFEIILNNTNKILICSDGLTNMLDDNEIKFYLETEEKEMLANYLINKANEKGGKDNISIIIIYDLATKVGDKHEA